MTETLLKRTTILLFAAIMILSSCNRIPERRHPLVLKAKSNIEKGNYPEAARLYEEYLLKNPKSSHIHQEAASVYFDYLNDPLLASFHYRQSIKYLPSKENNSHLKEWLKAAEEKHFQQLKNEYSDATLDKVKELKDKLFETEKQNTKFKRYLTYLIRSNRDMKRQLEQLSKNKKITIADISLPPRNTADKSKEATEKTVPPKAENPDKVNVTAVQKPQNVPTGSTFYVVKKGDTLMKISKKVYGASKYYKIIFESNRGILPSISKLSLGQRLVIPPLSDKKIMKEQNE